MSTHPEPFDSPLTLSWSKGARLAQDRLVEGCGLGVDRFRKYQQETRCRPDPRGIEAGWPLAPGDRGKPCLRVRPGKLAAQTRFELLHGVRKDHKGTLDRTPFASQAPTAV